MSRVRLAGHEFLSSKLTIFQSKMNILSRTAHPHFAILILLCLSSTTCLFCLRDVGNGILLDRPLPFKLHRYWLKLLSYCPLPCFIREFKFASQEIWSGPAECRQLPPANTLQKKCSDDGDDLNTAVGISLPR